MKATLSLSQLYWNASIGLFFMREQSYIHFASFYTRIGCEETASIEDWAEEEFNYNLDDFEEFCHENTTDEIMDAYNKFMGR